MFCPVPDSTDLPYAPIGELNTKKQQVDIGFLMYMWSSDMAIQLNANYKISRKFRGKVDVISLQI